MKSLVIIPAYNEEESLPFVMEELSRICPGQDYLIVNDGSSDGTAALCRKNNWNLLDLPLNLGLSGAFQAGIRYAERNGYDAVLQFDADGQHMAEHIARLFNELDGGYDIVIGSRFITQKKPKSFRILGSYLISFAMRFTTRKKICDPTSGMRAFNRRMIEEFSSTLNYTPEPDTISYLLHCGASVHEIQVDMRERSAGTSYFNAWRSIVYMVEICLSILLIQRFRPQKNFPCTPSERKIAS